jgi:hypothetical protein
VNTSRERPYRGLYAYAWDVAGHSPDAFAAELSRLSLNTLCLASSYHAGKFIRPHGAGSRVIFPEDGTAYFSPRPERYGKIRPQRASIVDDTGDLFETYSRRTDIALTAWTVVLHNTRAGLAHPGCTARNCFGDPYRYSLCPAHPDVQDYATALCADIADRYNVRGLVLETAGWMAYRHGYHHEFALLGENPWLDAMLGLCFCDHCIAGAAHAGIDGAGLKARTAARIDAYLAAAQDTPAAIGARWVESDIVADAELAAFLRWRCTVVTSLVARIRKTIRRDAELFVIPSVQRPAAAGWIEGADLPALAGAADGLEICCYYPDTSSAVADLAEVRRRVGTGAPIRAVLRPGPPDAAEEGAFARMVAQLAASAVDGFGFYNYGHLRAANLEWIGRALRQPSKG